MNSLIERMDALKAELAALLPLNKEAQASLWQKFRLEWNYNSNHIEGNTLSYGDTKLLFHLGDDFRAQNNSLKDVQEMRAHDVAIEMVKQWANDKERLIAESEIRALNETILVKSFWADAVTPNGEKTRREIIPGEYKKYPNHVQLKSGELFKYAEPNEVPQKMQELMDWYSSENEKEHPLVMAAFLHYKFVCIHPFDDGNGRVSRLLMNYHLLRNGYPPVIIKSKDKDSYLYALNQADAGNTDAFVKYVGEQLIWSLELQLKAAKGESIEEEDDLYKEIEVWKKKISNKNQPVVGKTCNVVYTLLQHSLNSLKTRFEKEMNIYHEFFQKYNFESKTYKNKNLPPHIEKLNKFFNKITNTPDHIRYKDIGKIEWVYFFFQPKTVGLQNMAIRYTVFFDQYKYTIQYNGDKIINKSYNVKLSEEEIEKIVKEISRHTFERIKRLSA